ncbi:transcriptional regulator [Tianweitania sediminis]|uniref:Helix-turn-helix domain-containing protein n=1 Tax=Tianweitania sediminis TaxID=1502156 RepID=A0A8J7R0F9_9HYPH|nr:Cro/CI family transcriptional regulator [Tianweitania sediminis]MBP0439610.1 helix-turn-helix domain-containing protein [Tianweitania sediminis]
MRHATPEDALVAAVQAAGSFSALARMLGITPQAVQQWRIVPAAKALQVAQLCGVSVQELRPDIFGSPAPAGTTSLSAGGAAGPVTGVPGPAVAEGC